MRFLIIASFFFAMVSATLVKTRGAVAQNTKDGNFPGGRKLWKDIKPSVNSKSEKHLFAYYSSKNFKGVSLPKGWKSDDASRTNDQRNVVPSEEKFSKVCRQIVKSTGENKEKKSYDYCQEDA